MYVQVEAAGDHPERVFRLDVSVTLPKWARVIDWTVRDDAMLLLGIYWCAHVYTACRVLDIVICHSPATPQIRLFLKQRMLWLAARSKPPGKGSCIQTEPRVASLRRSCKAIGTEPGRHGV